MEISSVTFLADLVQSLPGLSPSVHRGYLDYRQIQLGHFPLAAKREKKLQLAGM